MSTRTRAYRQQGVVVDVHTDVGLPLFMLIGGTHDDERATRDRLRAAILNQGYEWPGGRIIVRVLNGNRYVRYEPWMDLATIGSILRATGQFDPGLSDECEFDSSAVGLDGVLLDPPHTGKTLRQFFHDA